LEAELLKAVNGPHSPLREGELREIADRAIRKRRETWEAELTRMAADPQIRKELININLEFASAETDGLGKS
jgi:hypothetical protein